LSKTDFIPTLQNRPAASGADGVGRDSAPKGQKENEPQASARVGSIQDIAEGLRFIRDNRTIFILISMVGMTSLFGISYMILMPIFANDILKVGVKGLGVLMSAAGIGALIAALALAKMGDFKHKGRFLIFTALVFSLSLIVFSYSKNYLFSLATLVLLGWAGVSTTVVINTLLQQLAPDAVRGRVMSAFMFTFAGVMPFGNLLAGGLAHFWGVRIAVMLGGVVCALFFLRINLRYPQIRNI